MRNRAADATCPLPLWADKVSPRRLASPSARRCEAQIRLGAYTSVPGPSHALNAFLDLLAAYPAAHRFQPVHDVRLVRTSALQAGPAHGGDRGELGDRLRGVLHGGAG